MATARLNLTNIPWGLRSQEGETGAHHLSGPCLAVLEVVSASRSSEPCFPRSPAGKSFPGRTVVLVDVSGSMTYALSQRSEMLGTDAAYGLAVLLREVSGEAIVYSFSDHLVEVPARRGFALRDAVDASQLHNGTYLGKALGEIRERYDRIT